MSNLTSSGLARRALLRGTGLALAGAAVAPSRGARAGAITLRYANILPPSHPVNLRMAQAIERIHQETGGLLEIQPVVDSQAINETELLDMLQDGRLDFASSSAQVLGRVVPLAAITSLGFAFTSYEQVWPALDGPLGALVRSTIGASGMVVFDRIWDDGFHQITTDTKSIKAVADLKGTRVRVSHGPVALAMFRALGAAPASYSLSEVYPAIQNKVFEGQENPLAVVDALKLYEVQHLCAMTSHIWDGFWFLANGASHARLPVDLREILTRNINSAALAQRSDMKKANEAAMQRLVGHGMEFNTPEKMAPFRTALRDAGFYADWKRRLGIQAWSLLEQATGALV